VPEGCAQGGVLGHYCRWAMLISEQLPLPALSVTMHLPGVSNHSTLVGVTLGLLLERWRKVLCMNSSCAAFDSQTSLSVWIDTDSPVSPH
jgi:hypothetical protein